MAKKQKDFEYEFDPVKQAKDGKEAEKVISSNREAVSKRIIEQYKEPSLKEKVKFLTEF